MNNTYNTVDNQPHRGTTNTPPPQDHTTGVMEQIYQKVATMGLSDIARVEVNKLLACAIRAGVAWDLPAFFYEGFSNLTEAIKAGDPIDYEKLDGMDVHCVNPDAGGLHGTLKRVTSGNAKFCGSWWNENMDEAYTTALQLGWYGEDGWTLWVEGDIPLVRKTADQLEIGIYFLSETPGFTGGDASMVYVGENEYDDLKTIYYAPGMLKSTAPASEWIVLEEYGPFYKPDVK